MKQATFSGWEWLVEVSNHVGAGLLVLAAVGISAVSAVKLPHWWWGVIILAGFYALLFAEGAFRVYEASAGGNSGPPDVAVESRNVAAEVRTVRLIAAEIGAGRETVLAAIGVSQVYKTVNFTNWHAHHHSLAATPGARDAYRLASTAYESFGRYNDAVTGRTFISNEDLESIAKDAKRAEDALNVLESALDSAR